MSRRTDRLNEVFKREISKLLEREVNDPRLSNFISVTRVETSPDLRNAKVFVSVLGEESSKLEVIEGFNTAANFLRRKLSACIRLRVIPHLSFYYDDSIEQGARVLKVLDQVSGDRNSMTSADGKV
jgi:ribosome-binding factor A